MYAPNKSLGQNFLEDKAVAKDMVVALEISTNDLVIEIGPGLGAVTEVLVAAMKKTKYELYAVELDERFANKLRDTYRLNPNVHIINEDVLKYLPSLGSLENVKIIGSLPYYITSPIIHSIIKMEKQPEKAILLVQKEVAQKIVAFAPDASYISTFVQTFYWVNYVRTVPQDKFNPVPEVDGAVISLSKKESNLGQLNQKMIDKYEGFLHKAFKNPRKMLNKAFKKEELELANIKGNLRPQVVSVDEWSHAFKVIALK